MTFGPSKLSPAPWVGGAGMVSDTSELQPRIADLTWGDVSDDETDANSKFIAAARNAFDVMMRRGWGVQHGFHLKWLVVDKWGELMFDRENGYAWIGSDADPYTALIVADEWMKNKEARDAV